MEGDPGSLAKDLSQMPLVAIAGFQHETNSFAPVRAAYDAFVQPTNWPGLTRGKEMLALFPGLNLAIGGFIEAANAGGLELKPLVWANATPSGPVTRDAFERITALIVKGLEEGARADAIFLDLHGAMIAEDFLDGEAEILRRVRAVSGNDVPIVVSLDLHANVSPEMVALASALISCRTYPHVDLAETGRRSFEVLRILLDSGRRASTRLWKSDFLIPTQAQTTHCEPARRLYAEAAHIEKEFGLLDMSLSMGFGPADTPACGPAIVATGFDRAGVDAAVARLAEMFAAAEAEFSQPLLAPEAAIRRALQVSATGPAILADIQDNPGTGGTGDTTGLLAALAEARVEASVLAILHDPAAAAAAHSAGLGARLDLALGGRMGGPGSIPYPCTVEVLALGDGKFVGTGPMYGGGPMNFGPMALLRLDEGPQVIVGSVNAQAADQSILRHLGIVPTDQAIIALKSGVHFRADFVPIASEVIVVEAPGANSADHTRWTYRHLRPDVRLMPRA
jgi:microcystin degradation protein MlrC